MRSYWNAKGTFLAQLKFELRLKIEYSQLPVIQSPSHGIFFLKLFLFVSHDFSLAPLNNPVSVPSAAAAASLTHLYRGSFSELRFFLLMLHSLPRYTYTLKF